MIIPTPVPDRTQWRRFRTHRRRFGAMSFTLPAVLPTTPPRVFGHALVVVVCLVVAYAGRTNRLNDQIGFPPVQSDLGHATSSSFGDGLDALNALARPLDVNAESAGLTPPRLLVTHYDTQPGDTVATLADRFEISENTIIWTNDLSPDGQLEPGRELVILPVSGILHTVQAGETLGDLAQRFQSDEGALAQVNQLDKSVQLVTGTQLIIPGGRPELASRSVAAGEVISQSDVSRTDSAGAAAAAPLELPSDPNQRTGFDVSSAVDLFRRLPFVKTSEPSTPAPAQPAPTTPLKPIVYSVADGDTLSAIALKYGVSADAIAAASGIPSTNDALSIN